jgi:hypothetical protein
VGSQIVISLSPVAVSRETAACALGMSLSSFEVHVQPEIKLIRRGKLRLVPVRELEAWCERNAERTLVWNERAA